MQHNHVCIGGHDLDQTFRGVRLLDRFGDHWTSDSPFMVGDVWDLDYRPKASARPPHVEDVYVNDQRRVGQVADLEALVQKHIQLKHVRPWSGSPEVLFDRTVRSTPSGVAYIPTVGRLPGCSTGFWIPEDDLVRKTFDTRVRFVSMGESGVKRFAWVGVADAPERIEAGSLVRVSLSRLFGSETAPEGYYVQISGVL
jgi:hypothetical protein